MLEGIDSAEVRQGRCALGWWSRDRDRDGRRYDDISVDEVATRLADHMAQCTRDKESLREALDEHAADVDRKHYENLARFNRIEKTIYLAMGGGIVAGWLLTHGNVAALLK